MPHHPAAPRDARIHHSIFGAAELAKLIQADYGLPAPCTCTLFASGVNDIYRVEARGQPYLLRVARVQRYGAFDEPAYRFELDLLRFLHAHHVPVAYPLPRHNTDLLGVIEAPEGPRPYALFTFAPGDVRAALAPADAALLGSALAQVHRVANSFASPHARFHLDEAFLLNEPLRRLRTFPDVASADLAFLERLCGALREQLQRLAPQGDAYGIIHGDVWWHNAHFAAGTVTLFDFDFCGYGWRSYDLGCLRGTAKAFGTPLADEVVAAFLEGYQAIRPLTEPERQAMAAFEKIRVVWAFGLWTSLAEVLGTRWFYATFQRVFATLKQWVEEEAAQG
jgi:Ser/Thr protein kinase RdoA (MazF antagonist)